MQVYACRCMQLRCTDFYELVECLTVFAFFLINVPLFEALTCSHREDVPS